MITFLLTISGQCQHFLPLNRFAMDGALFSRSGGEQVHRLTTRSELLDTLEVRGEEITDRMGMRLQSRNVTPASFSYQFEMKQLSGV